MIEQQAAMVEGVSAEERQLQLDFHTLLADYVVGRRQVERHPDAEQRYVAVRAVSVLCGGKWGS